MRYGKLAVAALFVLAASQVQAQNLVSNPGFETGDFTGWNLVSNGNTVVADSTFQGPPYLPHSGSFFVAFGEVGEDGILSQNLSTTPNTLYDISYFMASDGAFTNHFAASFGSTTLFDQTDIPQQGYQQYDFQVRATGPTTTLTFRGRNDPSYLSLDDISVTAVPTASTPEPGTLGLLVGLGITATGVAYRRLRRRKG